MSKKKRKQMKPKNQRKRQLKIEKKNQKKNGLDHITEFKNENGKTLNYSDEQILSGIFLKDINFSFDSERDRHSFLLRLVNIVDPDLDNKRINPNQGYSYKSDSEKRLSYEETLLFHIHGGFKTDERFIQNEKLILPSDKIFFEYFLKFSNMTPFTPYMMEEFLNLTENKLKLIAPQYGMCLDERTDEDGTIYQTLKNIN